jgi:hypothetical protein
LASAGAPEVFTANHAISAATRSTALWIASEITATELMLIPTTSLAATRTLFETTDQTAARTLRREMAASVSVMAWPCSPCRTGSQPEADK